MKYDLHQIAKELDLTANGESYYGNALYVAMDLPFITKNDKACLMRYLYRGELSSDRFKLQDIATIVRNKGDWA